MNISSPEKTDKLLWDTWLSMYHLSAVTVADKIGLFEALNPCATEDELAQTLQTDTRAIKALTGVLVALGFLDRDDNQITLTQSSNTYLLPESPYYWGALLESKFNEPETQRLFAAIQRQDGELAHDGKSYSKMWKQGDITDEAAMNFTARMHATILAPAVSAIKSGVFDGTKHLLDVGGGSGCFSAAFVDMYADNQATVFELEPVTKVIPNYLKKLAVNGTINLHVGSFFSDDWPKHCDGILLSNILHDWRPEECKELLTKAFDALPQGGKIFIHEMLWDEDKCGPLAASCFDLLMYMNHGAQQFTKEELGELLRKVGFSNVECKQTFGYYSVVSAIK